MRFSSAGKADRKCSEGPGASLYYPCGLTLLFTDEKIFSVPGRFFLPSKTKALEVES